MDSGIHLYIKSITEMKILIAAGTDLNKQYCGWTALRLASNIGDKEVVKFLVKNGADINMKCNLDNTALMGASIIGNKEIVELFIEHRVDVNAKDNRGWTALTYALTYGRKDIAELLRQHGAK